MTKNKFVVFIESISNKLLVFISKIGVLIAYSFLYLMEVISRKKNTENSDN